LRRDTFKPKYNKKAREIITGQLLNFLRD